MRTWSAKGRTFFRVAACYLAAGVVGYLASLARVPLAWLLGPLVFTAGLSISGVEVVAPQGLRRLGQVIIGSTAGLNVTASVAAGLLGWIPFMVVTALFSVFVSGLLSPVFAKVARIDDKTSFFALMPGGLAEMGNIAVTVGARTEPIALVHTLRIAVVVLTIPSLLVSHATLVPVTSQPALGPGIAIALLAVSATGAAAISFLRVNNPWMIGALATTVVIAVLGLVEGQMPGLLFAAGQVLLGYNIGSRFKRDTLLRLPRIAVCGALFNLALLLVMIGYALALSEFVPMDVATAILVSSPGGISEMTSTAQSLQLAVALVTAFHVTRSVLVNGFATYYWAAFEKSGYFACARRILW